MASSVQKSKNYFEWKWWRWRSVNKIAKNIVSILFCHNCGFTSTKCTMIWPQSPDDYLPVSVSLTSYEFQWIVSFFTFHIFGWKTRNSIFFRWSKSFCERVLIAAEKKLAKQEISILEMVKISDDCMNISQLLGACNNNDIFVLNYWKCESEHTCKHMTMKINSRCWAKTWKFMRLFSHSPQVQNQYEHWKESFSLFSLLSTFTHFTLIRWYYVSATLIFHMQLQHWEFLFIFRLQSYRCSTFISEYSINVL